MDAVLETERQLVSAQELDARVVADDARDEGRQRFRTHVFVLCAVLGVVLYFVTGIYAQRYRFPTYFAWYEAMRKERVQGRGKHDFSMYQVAVASRFAPAQSLMELLLVWEHLSFQGALFLMMTVEHFRIKARTNPKAALTALHWNGSAEQTSYHKLLGTDGWASTGCATGTLAQKQQTLVNNWNRGKAENVWYELLPQPVDETGTQAFLSLPMIKELFADSTATQGTVSACDANSFFTSKIGMLYSGGLCHVAFAQTSADVSAGDLFQTYFATSVEVRQTCGGAAAAGAVQGATSVGSMGLFTGMMVPGIGVFLGIGLAIAGGVTGAVTSANAARETCQQEATEARGG